MVKFKLETKEDIQVLTFEIEGGIIEPSELRNIELELPKINYSKLVAISGRGPVWLFSTLTHILHPSSAVAVCDPRLGYIIVESHVTKFQVGDVIPV